MTCPVCGGLTQGSGKCAPCLRDDAVENNVDHCAVEGCGAKSLYISPFCREHDGRR